MNLLTKQADGSGRFYEYVIDNIRQMIADGELQAGQKLPSERELAEKFNVSRVPIREALKILEYMGVLDSSPGDGTYVKNTSAQVSTALSFAPSEYGVTFTLNGGEALPGVVQVEMTGDNAAYTRVYLHNALKGKWQFLNSYKDHVLEADTAGEYLLTTQNLRFVHVDMTFFIAGLVVIVGIIIAYIVIKKRYWFW